MRIAIVCPYAWDRHGGVQSHVRALASVLKRRRHDVAIIATRSDSSTKDVVEEGVTIVGRAIGIPANGSVAPVAFGPLAAAGVRRALRAFEPDVLHLHEPLIPSLSLLALWNSDVPAVGTFHASAEASFGYQVGKPALSRAMKSLAVRAAVSPAARELISRYFPGDYEITPNGVDVARFRDAEPLVFDDFKDDKIILFLGRIERRKGLEVLIRAMAQLGRDDVTLAVAGSGPEGAKCRSLCEELGVSARFLGRLSEDALPCAYKGAEIYCAPGLGGESFGIVLIEAMAAGTPVVCSDLPAFRAVAGDAAVLVPPDDPAALAAGLAQVLDDRDKAHSLRTAAEAVAARYDWGRLVEAVEKLYERAASSSPRV